MPLLFYGRLNGGRRKLYDPRLREIETSVFDNWKIRHLAPHSETKDLRDLANFWWFRNRNHCAISWHDSRKEMKEQSVFIPQLLSPLEALHIARTEFPGDLVPSPLVFRWNNENEIYYYE